MKRWNLTLFLLAATLPACSESTPSNKTASNQTAPAKNPSSMTDFGGTWLLESAELGGAAMPGLFLTTTTMTIQGDEYTVLVAGQPDRGTFRYDDTQSPKTMDITGVEGPNQGTTFLAIYQWLGERLQICYDLSAVARPTEFATKPGTQQFLVTYQRK